MKGATVVIDQVTQIDITDLRVAQWNARKTFDPARTEELKASISAHGIQVPLIIRVVGGVCEIVAGHRRFYSALALWEKGDERFERLPCICRDLDDDQAREIGLVDNLQREDVPALEEADAYKELQQRLGTPAAIAARVGKDVSYVARRLQLISLTEMPRKALSERLITIDHALLLARLGEEEQNVNLKWALNPNSGIKEPVEETIKQRIEERDRKEVRWSGYWEPQSVLDLKHHIERNVGRKLSRAPWSLDDATLLQNVPACNSCPSNTKHNETLFGDMNIDAATCEDGGCFELKRVAFVSIQLGKIPKVTVPQPPIVGLNNLPKYLFPLRLSWKETSVPPRAQRKGFEGDREGFAPEQVFRHGQWIEAKAKSCDFVRQGVTVDWSDDGDRGFMGAGGKVRKPGQLLTVCIAQKCKVHKKRYVEAEKRNGADRNENSEANRAKREERAKEAAAENEIRHAHFMKAVDQVKKLDGELLRAIVLRAMGGWLSPDDNDRFPGLDKALKEKKVDSTEFARAAACVLFVGGNNCRGFWDEEWQPSSEATRKKFIAALKVLGYDASKAWEKPADAKLQSTAAKKAAKPAPRKQTKKVAKKKGGRG